MTGVGPGRGDEVLRVQNGPSFLVDGGRWGQ